jgi:CheY-like chemotaxis protein
LTARTTASTLWLVMGDDKRGGTPRDYADDASGVALRVRVRARVLLIQPDPVLGVALSQFLSGYFAQVALATSPDTALGMLRSHAGYAAVLLDDAIGVSALRQVAEAAVQARPLLRRRMVLLGASLPDAAALGIRVVLAKPMPASTLLAAVDGCVGPGLRRALPRVLPASVPLVR